MHPGGRWKVILANKKEQGKRKLADVWKSIVYRQEQGCTPQLLTSCERSSDWRAKEDTIVCSILSEESFPDARTMRPNPLPDVDEDIDDQRSSTVCKEAIDATSSSSIEQEMNGEAESTGDAESEQKLQRSD